MLNKSIILIAIVYFIGVLATDIVTIPSVDPQLLCRFYYRPEFNEPQIPQVAETVKVELFYESRCKDCILEYPYFPALVDIFRSAVDVRTYPFGNAKATAKNIEIPNKIQFFSFATDGGAHIMMHEENDTIVVKCQHGEEECYGNKLHACAIDSLKTTSSWVHYNSCLMVWHSDDEAADFCGKRRQVDSEPIKECAKSEKGHQLLIHYGNLSLPHHYSGVPYILINGQPKSDDESLFPAVCKAFKVPPPFVCSSFL